MVRILYLHHIDPKRVHLGSCIGISALGKQGERTRSAVPRGALGWIYHGGSACMGCHGIIMYVQYSFFWGHLLRIAR